MQQIYNLFDGFSDDSRVWLYNASRPILNSEIDFINEGLERFTSQWKAHSLALLAKACVLNEYTIVFVVDQSQTNASGCAIDSSVRFVKELGDQLKLDFFKRMNVVVENEDGSRSLHPYGKLNELTNGYYYDPLVSDLKSLKSNYKKSIV